MAKDNSQQMVEALLKEGTGLYEKGSFNEAEGKFKAALQIMPSSETLMYNLALVYLEQKEYQLAWNLVDKIKTLDSRELIEALRKVDPTHEVKKPTGSKFVQKNVKSEDTCPNCGSLMGERVIPESIKGIRSGSGYSWHWQKYYTCPKCSVIECFVEECTNRGEVLRGHFEVGEGKAKVSIRNDKFVCPAHADKISTYRGFRTLGTVLMAIGGAVGGVSFLFLVDKHGFLLAILPAILGIIPGMLIRSSTKKRAEDAGLIKKEAHIFGMKGEFGSEWVDDWFD